MRIISSFYYVVENERKIYSWLWNKIDSFNPLCSNVSLFLYSMLKVGMYWFLKKRFIRSSAYEQNTWSLKAIPRAINSYIPKIIYRWICYWHIMYFILKTFSFKFNGISFTMTFYSLKIFLSGEIKKFNLTESIVICFSSGENEQLTMSAAITRIDNRLFPTCETRYFSQRI